MRIDQIAVVARNSDGQRLLLFADKQTAGPVLPESVEAEGQETANYLFRHVSIPFMKGLMERLQFLATPESEE